MSDPQPAEAPPLERLPAKWREDAKDEAIDRHPGWVGAQSAYERCADELATILAEGEARRRVPPILVDRDADLRRELRGYLDTLTITGENIGDIRRSLFVPWESAWNGWVRDETAERENAAPLVRSSAPTQPQHAEEKDSLSRLQSDATSRDDRIHADTSNGDT